LGNAVEASAVSSNGPLAGLKILEVESIGPGPFAGMVFADLGANVLRIARPSSEATRTANSVLGRGRTATLTLDLKSAHDTQRLLRLIDHADALIEGFRPGVMERIGLGPDPCLSRNPRLVYGRVTGWGRSGPLAQTAGHDINYIALTGALYACGTAGSGPMPPLNLVGDFGGGGLLLAFGVVCALLEARNSGRGQVVDAAMTGGAALLMAMLYGMRANGRWPAARAGNMFDGSAYFYTCYPCSDGGWMAVGAIEPKSRLQLLQLLGLAEDADTIMAAPDNDDATRARLAQIFLSRTRAEWQQVFDGTDACVTPVLQMDEVMKHEQNRVRGNFALVDGVTHPGPAPNFSRTPSISPERHPINGDRNVRLQDWGLTTADVE
jgi:alpha-methylacyl-CoA racemase